jgi:hypothetical protein
VKRRNFLQLTIAGGLATAIPFCKPQKPTHTSLNTPKFLAAICDIQTIRKIGTDYRSATPAENRESQLNDLLTEGLDRNKDQTDQLLTKIKADFAAGRTVTIDGWVIAVTEARQCALNSLQLP